MANDSTSIPSLKTIFPSTSAALNESAEARPGSRPSCATEPPCLAETMYDALAINGR